jgi:hypothetical protein
MQIRTRLLMVFHIICLILNRSSAQQGGELGGNTLMANAVIATICSDPAGNIYAAGGFTDSSHKYYVAKWNGSAWNSLGGNTLAANGGINSICSDAAGNIYAAGGFANASGNAYVAKWDGSTWSELGGTNALAANSNINTICTDAAGNLYAGGYFQNGTGTSIVAKWNGNTWSQLGAGFTYIYNGWSSAASINSLCTDPSGHVYAAGSFIDTSSNYYIAEWIDTAWIELGSIGVSSAFGSICSDPSGNIYAPRNFYNGDYWTYIAKWNGSAWSELGDSTLSSYDYVTVVYSDASGNIYTNGTLGDSISPYHIAKWNGTVWSQQGGNHALPINHGIYTICSDTSGNIYAGGSFTNSSGNEYVAEFAKNEVVYNDWFDTICQGSSVIVGYQPYMASGTYTDTLMAVQGGDSVVNLHLTIDTLRRAPTVSLTLDSMIAIGDLSAGQGFLDTSFFWWNCLNPAAFRLTGGSPPGGIYSGRWISNDSINIPTDFFDSQTASTDVQTFAYTYTDSGGCYANVLGSFPLTQCGDSNGVPSQPAILLYPNPTSGIFTLVTTGSIGSQYTITDMMGKVVAQDIINSPSQNISLGLDNGVYILTISQSVNISILEGLSDYTTLGPQSMRFVVMR